MESYPYKQEPGPFRDLMLEWIDICANRGWNLIDVDERLARLKLMPESANKDEAIQCVQGLIDRWNKAELDDEKDNEIALLRAKLQEMTNRYEQQREVLQDYIHADHNADYDA